MSISKEYDEIPPDASSMIESLRAHGYTFSTAVADIIDNSIAARCSNVWLSMDWNNGYPWVSITDDGEGMSEDELVAAMRLGSTNPLEERDPSDLGRFGLGLKTASFSQARRLSVSTRKAGACSVLRRWDLDHLAKPEVKGWQLLKTVHDESGDKIEGLEARNLDSGTVVLLEVLDRVVRKDLSGADKDEEQHWVAEVQRVRQHLSMVFHRYLSDRSSEGVRMHLNDSLIESWDPFCEDENATQKFAVDVNSDLGGSVSVKGYVLPHRDKFDPTDQERSRRLHAKAAGSAGWNAQQGFYLYRNRRLIIPGDWLGLGPGQSGWKKEEHFKLARIQVDIPNSMDQEWQIDVKKSSAIAPPPLRYWMTGLAKTVRERAKQVYAHRGGRPRTQTAASQPEDRNPWLTKTGQDGRFSYRIDRRHPLLKALAGEITAGHKLETLLRLIEETVPVQRIWIDTAEREDGVAAPFSGESDTKLRKHIILCHKALLSSGKSESDGWRELLNFPAFQSNTSQALIVQLKEEESSDE